MSIRPGPTGQRRGPCPWAPDPWASGCLPPGHHIQSVAIWLPTRGSLDWRLQHFLSEIKPFHQGLLGKRVSFVFSAMKAAVVLFSLCCQESRGSLWLDIFGWRHIQTRWLEMSSPDSVLPAPVNRTHETEQMRKRTGWREGALNLYPLAPQTCSGIHASACSAFTQPDSVSHSDIRILHFIISSKDLLICLHPKPATECKGSPWIQRPWQQQSYNRQYWQLTCIMDSGFSFSFQTLDLIRVMVCLAPNPHVPRLLCIEAGLLITALASELWHF